MAETPVTPAVSPVSLLLVDDESRNLDVLESLLSTPEYNLVRAQTAEEALMLLLDGEFAAIVLDIQMPNMNGIELATLIKQRKRTQHIPIIFLTAYFQEDKDVLQGYGSGAVDYLTKPINPQILRSKIAVFVDLFRKTRALTLTNAALETEISQRLKAEEALREMNSELEARVQARTADLVQLNQELALARDRALAASGAKDDFLARLSHELRTPLNPVLLLASEAAGNPALSADIRADFSLIAENVALEARLIDDLLDLTRISRGKLVLEMRSCDVHSLLHDTIGMVQAELTRKQLVVTLELGAPNAIVRGDDVRLKQIFWNVLSNAVKFTPEGGSVAVETFVPSDDRIAIRVADSGHGMTPPELERIFQAFSQGDHAVEGAHRFGGLGLGLAISRTLVDLHHGMIRASSEGRGKGTTFTIEFPTIGEQAPAGASSLLVNTNLVAHGATPGGRRRRVLLVEDHQPTRTTLATLLSRRQFEVVTADCVAAARTLADRSSFDLVVSDIGLPDGSGHELMKSLKAARPALIGIALTGYGMEEDLEKSRTVGFISHLTKPVSMQALDYALAEATRAMGQT